MNGRGAPWGRTAARCGAILFVTALALLAPASAAAAASPEDPEAILARGRELADMRQRLVDDYTAWARELEQQAGVGAEGAVSLADAAHPRVQFVDYVQRLARLGAVEAIDLGTDYLGLTATDAVGRVSRPAEDLLVAIGRPASLRLADRLRADPDSPRLKAALERIEGTLSDAVIRGAVPPAPAPAPVAAPTRAAGGGLEVVFVQIPGLPQPNYSGHGTKTVLDLAARRSIEGPSVSRTPQLAEDFRSLVEQVGALGDAAIVGSFLLVPTGRFGLLDAPGLQAIPDGDLAAQVTGAGTLVSLERERVVLLATRDGRYALVQYLGTSRHEPLLAYVVQPDGSGVFPIAPIRSLWAMRDAGATAGELMAHGAFVHQRETTFWDRSGRTAEAIGRLVSGAVPADARQREEAVRLLGRLRQRESAGILIEYVEGQPEGKHGRDEGAALASLRALWPGAREALLERLEATSQPARRARLAEVLEALDGPEGGRVPGSGRGRPRGQ